MKYVIVCSFNSNSRIELNAENNPVWDYFAEPTLSILKKAYQEQKDRLEIFEPLIEPIKIEPNWGQFNRFALMSDVVKEILIQTSEQYAVANLRAFLSPLGYTGLSEVDYSVLQFLWGQIIAGLPAPPTTSAIAQLNAIAETSQMIFIFDQAGLIVFIAS